MEKKRKKNRKEQNNKEEKEIGKHVPACNNTATAKGSVFYAVRA
jgi:hypothetical protein